MFACKVVCRLLAGKVQGLLVGSGLRLELVNSVIVDGVVVKIWRLLQLIIGIRPRYYLGRHGCSHGASAGAGAKTMDAHGRTRCGHNS